MMTSAKSLADQDRELLEGSAAVAYQQPTVRDEDDEAEQLWGENPPDDRENVEEEERENEEGDDDFFFEMSGALADDPLNSNVDVEVNVNPDDIQTIPRPSIDHVYSRKDKTKVLKAIRTSPALEQQSALLVINKWRKNVANTSSPTLPVAPRVPSSSTVPVPLDMAANPVEPEVPNPNVPPQFYTHPLPEFIILPVYDYEAILTRAARVFKHLKKGRVRAPTRHSILVETAIHYIDYSENTSGTINRLECKDLEGLTDQDLSRIPQGVKQRLVIVEDISPEIIRCLGTQYGVSPEFFEEHLLNSGYNGAYYTDESASRWTTSGMKKSHTSVRWHRPVNRLPVVPFSKQDLRDLLDPAEGRLEYTLTGSNDLGIFQTETNIFRKEWEMWTDPRITVRSRRPCGWEERASIWTREVLDGCRIVILILDPLPTLTKAVERRRIEKREVAGTHSRHPTNQNSENSSNAHATHPRSGDVEAVNQDPKDRLNKQPNLSRLQRMMQNITKTRKTNPEPPETPRRIQIVETKDLDKLGSIPVIQQITPRADMNIEFEQAFQDEAMMNIMKDQLYDTRSTKEEFLERVMSLQLGDDQHGCQGVVQPLFEIIQRDTLSLLKVLQNALDQINLDILDDSKIEESLAMWRELITRSQFELPELKRSLISLHLFMANLSNPDLVSAPHINLLPDPRVDRTNRAYEMMCTETDAMIKRLKTASSSLTQNMALLDSRRSIAEAEGIAKLTELAFFFIPLTFAATLFGMEIEQLQQPAPLSLFIAIGLTFTVASYLIRLMIRSMWIRTFKQSCNTSMKMYAERHHYEIQRGGMPASVVLGWLGHETKSSIQSGFRRIDLPKTSSYIWKSAGFVTNTLLMIAVLVTAPIAILWTRPINQTTQTLITLLIIIIVVPTVVITYWNSTSPEVRSRSVRFWKTTLRGFKTGRSKFAMTISTAGALAAIAVPLAIVWTRPLSMGIQVAITVTIIFIALFSLMMLGLPSIPSRMAMRDMVTEEME